MANNTQIRRQTRNRMSAMSWVGFVFLIICLGLLSYVTFQNWQKIDLVLNYLQDATIALDVDAILEGEDAAEEGDATADQPELTEEELLARTRIVLAEAEQAVDLAFNLLGIFEALSLAITVGGVVLTAFGLTRFTTARNELEETRKLVEEQFLEAQERVESQFEEAQQRVEDQLKDSRQQFETTVDESKRAVVEMREDLEHSAQEDRKRTSDALLANALIPIGERQYKASDLRGAIHTYNRALTLDPENPVINQRLGYVYAQTGELEQAKNRYEKAIAREEDFAPALAGLGFVQRRFGENVGKQINDDLSADERQALLFERDRLFNESERLLLEALNLSPKLVDDDGESYWGILGGLYKRRGQIEQAIEAYTQVTIVTPQSSYGYGNLATLYQQASDREHALETYKIVEQIASKEAEAEAGNFWGYSDLISSSFAIGKYEQALEKLPIAISIAPLDSPYMLEGLRDTLVGLLDFLQEEEKLPPIHQAVEILNAEIARRATLDS